MCSSSLHDSILFLATSAADETGSRTGFFLARRACQEFNPLGFLCLAIFLFLPFLEPQGSSNFFSSLLKVFQPVTYFLKKSKKILCPPQFFSLLNPIDDGPGIFSKFPYYQLFFWRNITWSNLKKQVLIIMSGIKPKTFHSRSNLTNN